MDGGALRTRCLDNPNIKNESALGDTLPVFKVNWIEANGLCNWLTQQTTFAQERAFRLPTTKEWRCAAAAGMQTAFCFGSDELFFEEFDWYRKNSKFVQESAKLPPSLGGLFDIHGNVSEWVTDASSYNPMEKKFHGSNWNSETNQGAARFESPKMRSLPDLGWSTLGFRIVQNLGPSQASTKTD
jgi:formylglycine-generating enzyme required for sulfatase activity